MEVARQTIASIWRENMLGYLSADIICSEWRTVFRERSSRKTVSYKEQIMSKDKYPSICSPQMEAIVFIILQIFYATRAALKIGEYPRIFPSFSWGIFTHMTRLDQSRASENIWWIINRDNYQRRLLSFKWLVLLIRAPWSSIPINVSLLRWPNYSYLNLQCHQNHDIEINRHD